MLIGQVDAREIHLLPRLSVRWLGGRSAALRFLNKFQSDPAAMESLTDFLGEREGKAAPSGAAAGSVEERLSELIANGEALVGAGPHLLWRHEVSSWDRSSALTFLRRFKTSQAAMWNLRQFVWKGTVSPDLSKIDDDRILEKVASWVASGEVVVGFRMLLRGGGDGAEEAPTRRLQPAAAAAPTAPRLRKTWIEFVVVDMEGNRVSGQPFRVMLPDGSLHEGKLDKTGAVRFDGIDPENCVFSLTGLDQEAWERIG